MGTKHIRGRRIGPLLAALALTTTPALAAEEPTTSTTPIVVRVDGGFSWTEAGIGVVAGAGAALAAVGGAALLRPSSEGSGQRKEQPDDL